MEENKKNNKEHEHKHKHKHKHDNDKSSIHNSENPIINVKVNCCSDHNKDKKDDHKKHDDSCCKHKEVERQVNNPTNDIINFPRITQSETSLAHFNDFILYGFNDTNNTTPPPEVPGTHSFSGFAFSNDLGDTWTDGGPVPVNPGGFNDGDPVIAKDRNGVFYYGQVGREVVAGTLQGVISVSTGTVNPNGTITMNLPQVVGRGQNPNPNTATQDKEWIAVGPDADNPGNEALYITWTDFTVDPRSIRFSKYTTGVNLNPIITDQVIVPPSANNFISGSFVVVDNRGVIYVFYEEISDPNPADMIPPRNYLNDSNRTIRMLKSTDGGNTFPINVPVSIPFFAAANEISNCAGNIRPTIRIDTTRLIRTNEFPHAAIGPDGTLYVVWNAGRVIGNTRFIDIFLAYSTDEGNTWNEVNISTHQNLAFSFFPSVAANCEGAHIQYNRFNDRRGRVGGVGDGTFAIFMKSFSPFDGLSKERMVSTEFSPVPITIANPDPIPAGCYMGDYNQIIAGPGSCLLHSWGDNRNVLNGQINPDVFFRLTAPKKKHDCCCDYERHV
ncbi:glycoside hydrolase [Bacillus sp. N5-665]|uniref:sialidase family protein n=1 Tax=Bacillus sp. N5-665 TaxID=2925318 RepID=UPI001F539E04|nr:sialidase family protein [Bacillus sp. N5-665]UNK35294.1 glycoside hydrolase [Bacillus sp. N5-665]